MDNLLPQLSGLFSGLPGGAVLWSALMFIVVLSVLVYVHEMGHYLAARSVGVFVNTFSIGFGRELFGWNDKRGTRWKVALIPLGGYVSMLGEMDEGDVPASRKHESFLSKNVWARMWVVVAGPLANVLFTIFALMALMWVGEQRPIPQVGGVMEGSAAAEAGLEPGDTITAINGQAIQYWDELVETVGPSAGKTLNLEVQRGEETLALQMTPQTTEVTNVFGETTQIGRIGVLHSGATVMVRHSFVEGMGLAFVRTWEMTAATGKAIWRMATRQMSAEHVGGPIMIAQLAGETAEQGPYALVLFMAIISLNLALINMFPIPVLDGGRLVFYIIEALKGSPMSERSQEWGFRFGMLMIAMLMVLAFYNDIMRLLAG